MSTTRVAGTLPGIADPILEAIAANLETTGFAVVPSFLETDVARELIAEMKALKAQGELKKAAIGRGQTKKRLAEVRTDFIHWLEPLHHTPAQRFYHARMEELRETLNRFLFLGLFELEAHLACFAPGGFYKAHLDQHQHTRSRILSAVVYLDDDWQTEDGGQLRLFTDRTAGTEGDFIDIFPEAGKLALFLSADFWHEVRLSHRERHSVTGWYRQREAPVLGLPM